MFANGAIEELSKNIGKIEKHHTLLSVLHVISILDIVPYTHHQDLEAILVSLLPDRHGSSLHDLLTDGILIISFTPLPSST